MTTKRRYPLAEALEVATALKATLEPTCARLEVGGSIRRLLQVWQKPWL